MPINAAVGSALVSGGSSLIGSIIQAHAQSKANATYLKGIREVNEANKQLYEQQMRDTRTNWSLENAYNSPSAQLSRLRQAGINVSDMMSNGNASQIQTVSASPNVAPNQVQTPNYGGIVSEPVQAAFAGYQKAQEAEMSKLGLYQKGIENQFFYRQKLNEIRLQEAEILSKDTINAQDAEKLYQLRMDSKFYEDNLKRQMSINDETWKNLQKSGREIDARISREDAVAVATMSHMKVQEAVDWFNAHTSRRVSDNDAKRIGNEFGLGIVNLYHDWKKYTWNKEVQQKAQALAENYYHLSSSQQLLARAIMAAQLKNLDLTNEKLQQLMSSPFGNIIRDVLGLDPSVIGSAAVGAGAAVMVK